MFCQHCGKGRSGDGTFCTHCGQPFDGASAQVLPAVRTDAPTPGRGRRAAIVGGALLVVAGLLVGGAALARSHHVKTNAHVAALPAATTAPPSPSPSSSPAPVTAPSSAAGFPGLYKQDSAGVIRIETTACDGGGVGTGFLVAPDMIATVAHVVQSAVSVVLRQGAITTTGTVVGIDPARELALVRSSVPLTGHVFALADSQPDVGVDVAAIGYPLAGPESLSKGTVSGLDRPLQIDAVRLTGLIQTDTPINPGNSGGPLVTADGTVVGLVEAKTVDAANIGFAVPASTARAQVASWQAAPVPVRTVLRCGAPTGPQDVQASITDRSGSSDGPAIARAFETYATGINTGDYASAYAVLSPRSQAMTSQASFARGDASSYIVSLDLVSVTPTGSGQDSVEVQFTSVQDPVLGGNGQACSSWQLTYTLVNASGGWLIDRAAPHPGSPAPC